MLTSQKEERGRRFILALRAGIPVLLLVFIVFYTTLGKNENITISLRDEFLLAAITFITIYFIYFLMNLSVQETMIDETTQGFNKKAFIKKLEHDKPNTLAYLNVANLESLNENYSSDQIDNLLYTITKKLNLTFKQHGLNNVLIGRNRGSEFLIALDHMEQDIHTILKTIVTENSHINHMDVEYKFAVIHLSDDNFDKAILQVRDLVASQSEDKHKETQPETIKNTKELSEIEKSVIQSIQNKKLILSFRPLLNTHTDTIDTYEIAVKLKDDSNKDILPRIFLPIVNRLGLGREYDLMLVKHIINLLPLVDKNISFTFNLSPFSLRDKNFQEKLFNYIHEREIDPKRLIIQLYERKTHHDLSGYLNTLSKFRSHGLRICIDNFGSSNASMEYMKHFKFDIVQFDRDYVTNLEDNTTHAMLHSLIKMSKDLQVQTVAKWVDNEEQKKKLRALGINYIQGFGVSKSINERQLIDKYN